MRKAALILTHLACVLAGWGIFSAATPSDRDGAGTSLPAKSPRDTRVRRDAELLLERLRAGIPEPEAPSSGEIPGDMRDIVLTESPEDPFDDNQSQIQSLNDFIALILFGHHGPDLAYAFRYGRIEAGEILKIIAERFPALDEDLLVKALIKELGPIDPLRISGLIDLLPLDERDRAVRDLGWEGEIPNHPEKLAGYLDLLFSHPSAPIADVEWLDLSTKMLVLHDTWGNHYVTWLLDQPPSRGRDLSLHTLGELLTWKDPPARVRRRAECNAGPLHSFLPLNPPHALDVP